MPSKKGKKQSQKPYSLLVKPASADCNLQCDYCFYLEKSALYPESTRHRMTLEILERLISTYLGTKQPVYSFGWQGGEPTLMGDGFFRTVTDLQQKHGRPGVRISNGLQTNGTRITPELARHLKEYNFLVGISIDGPEDIHNIRRVNAAGAGSYTDVIRGLQELQRHGVETNVLVLVHKDNVRYPEKIYRHLIDLGLYYHQYIPCVETDGQGGPLPWSINGKEWGDFLQMIFGIWRQRDMQRVSIRNFDAILKLLTSDEVVMCTLGRNCSEYFVVEYNGDVYPCDFFVEPSLLIGNVFSNSWEEMRKSEVYKRFGRQKNELPGECNSCEYLSLCTGDCPKHRTESGKSRLCGGIKSFYNSTLEDFKIIANDLKARR